jgi:hypothetical protein
MKYDAEEQNIIDAYESGTMKLFMPDEKELEYIKNTAGNTMKYVERDLILKNGVSTQP